MDRRMSYFLSLVKLCLCLSLGWPGDGQLIGLEDGGYPFSASTAANRLTIPLPADRSFTIPPLRGGGGFALPQRGGKGFTVSPEAGGFTDPLSDSEGFTIPPTRGVTIPTRSGGDFTIPPTTNSYTLPLSNGGGFTIPPTVGAGNGLRMSPQGTTSFPTAWSSGGGGVGRKLTAGRGRRGPAGALRRARLRLLTRNDDIHYGSMSDTEQWRYTGLRGCKSWQYVYPSCGRNAQSPINIDTQHVIVQRQPPLQFVGYGIVTDSLLENIEHSVQIRIGEHASEMSGGVLPGSFILETLHFHWGSRDTVGSEHTINSKHFPMEMHMVHYNKRYGSFGDSRGMADGTAVLAFFFTIGRYNPEMQVIIDELPNVVYPDSQSRMPAFSLNQLMDTNLSQFYSYHGSLTTPPCSETVSWVLMSNPIEISDAQMLSFQTALLNNDFTTMGDNYRPIFPLNGRRVYANDPALRYTAVPFSPLGFLWRRR